MGLLSSMFGKRKQNEQPEGNSYVPLNLAGAIRSNDNNNYNKQAANAVNINPATQLRTQDNSNGFQGIADAYGLYPSELIMLGVAEKYKVTEKDYPEYLKSTYKINSPKETAHNLQQRGFLEEGSAKDCLQSLKVEELKILAEKIGISVKGKKAEIVEQLMAADDIELNKHIKEKNWKLTEKGQKALKESPYIAFFLEKHEYNLSEVRISLWDINREYYKNTKQPYRDAIYRALNQRQNDLGIKIQMGDTANLNNYCNCFRIMGLFLEEEKKYSAALTVYLWYLYRSINLKASLDFLQKYQLTQQNSAFNINPWADFYENCRLYPFNRKPLERLLEEAKVAETNVKQTMVDTFERANDTGIMTGSETADFLIYELNGEHNKAKDLCVQAASRAIRKRR